MNINLLRWWKSIESIINNSGWDEVRAALERQLPTFITLLAAHSSFGRKLVIVAASSKVWRYFSLNSYGMFGGIVFCAPTLNNRKSIERVQELCGFRGEQFVDRWRNYTWFILSFFKMVSVIFSRNGLRNRSIVSHIMFAQYLHSYFYFHCILSSIILKGALVANDHSPFQCGFLAAAEKYRLKLIYVQHAHVTALFPPLKFDLSLLYGRHAQDIYASRGTSKGGVFLIGSGKTDQQTTSMSYRVPAVLRRVGIALTNLPPTEYLFELIQSLKKIAPGLEVFIRAHPRTKPGSLEILAKYAEIRVGTTVAEDAQRADVFICGNSSIVIELLKHRVPVAVSNLIDQAPDDYYGFIRSRVVPAAEPVGDDWWRRIVNHFGGDGVKNAEYFDISFSKSDEDIASELRQLIKKIIDEVP